jgi:carbamoylphosphate synthase small subunit
VPLTRARRSWPLLSSYAKDSLGLHKFLESGKIQVSGLVVSDYSEEYSHFEAVQSLHSWMESEGELGPDLLVPPPGRLFQTRGVVGLPAGIPGISGIDTRALTKKIRDHGVMLG